MRKSATEVMQEILLAAVVDAVVALRDASKGVPNTLLRDLNAIHANTTFADLPPALQAALTASVRGGFNRLLKEGYSVSEAGAAQPPRPQTDVRRPPSPGHRPNRPSRGRPDGPKPRRGPPSGKSGPGKR